MNILKAIIGAILLIAGTALNAQNRYTVSGEVSDAETGENLLAATVYVAETTLGSSTNSYGFYSLTVPEGEIEIICSYIGYKEFKSKINLNSDRHLNIQMVPQTTELDEVVVRAEKADQNLSSLEVGVEKLDVASISKVPVLLGEKDVLKTIQLMPGISTISEGSAGFSVRGGSVDQNLILLDESPVYSASHLMGFFSIFNADAIKDVSVYKGGIPANYGGRAASVVDLQMKDGNNQKFSGSGGIGLISSRLTLEGPIVKDKSSFIVSGRRSYADLVATATGFLEEGTSLYFYDLNAKLNYRINDNNRIFLSGYTGKDEFGFEEFGTEWGNITGTFRWNHLFGPRLFSNTTLLYSNYDYGFNVSDQMKMSSGIEDFAFKEDFSYFLNPNNTLKFGLNGTYHIFNPGELIVLGSENEIENELVLDKKQALESGLFLSNETIFNSKFSAEYGIRFSMFNQLGEGWDYQYNESNERIDSTWYGKGELMQTYTALEPRISLNYRIDKQSSLKASFNRISQYLHLLSNSTSGQPTDTWVPSTSNIKPVTVNQFSLGYYRNFLDNKLEFSVESYYKDMNNISDYEDGTNVLLNEDIEASILSGNGRSYGLEFYLKKKFGKLNGWISYTLARTEQQIDGINNFEWYAASYDKKHDLSVVLSYDFSDRLSLSGSWIYYTGNAVTFPSGKYNYDNNLISYYTERNGYRMPAYHRLDLNLHLEGKKKERWETSWDFSLYNAYNRHNAYTISFSESETYPGTTEAVKLSLFGIVPSVTWNFKF